MKKFTAFFLALAVAILVSPAAFAVIIEGSFKGSVSSFSNGEPAVNFTGYWENVDIGSEVTGSFWYDTSAAPKSRSDYANISDYFGYTDNWAGSTFHIDGKTFVTSELPLFDRYVIPYESVRLWDLQPDVDGSTMDRFSFGDSMSSGGFFHEHNGGGLSIEITSEMKPLLNGLGLIQEFDWYKTSDSTSYGQAYISRGISFGNFTGGIESTAWVDVSEFHLKIRDTASVPEASSLSLILLSLLGLWVNRRAKITANSAQVNLT